MNDHIKAVEAPDNPNIPEIRPGDTVKVFLRITEAGSERIQEFRGMVIRLRSGGNDKNFTVRRVASNGVGVERTFLMRSPRIEKSVKTVTMAIIKNVASRPLITAMVITERR